MKKATNLPSAKDVPGGDAKRGLLLDDDAEVERSGAEHDADERKTERQFVADELRRGAKRAEQGVFVVRRPAGKGDAVDADGSDAENHEQADVDIGDLKEIDAVRAHAGRAEWNDGNGDERAAERDDGREKIKRPIDGGGDQVFLEEGLCAVDERLQQAEWANAAGAPAILNAADELALEEHGVGDAHEHHHRDHGDFGQAPEKECEDRHVRLAFFEQRVSKLVNQRVKKIGAAACFSRLRFL